MPARTFDRAIVDSARELVMGSLRYSGGGSPEAKMAEMLEGMGDVDLFVTEVLDTLQNDADALDAINAVASTVADDLLEEFEEEEE